MEGRLKIINDLITDYLLIGKLIPTYNFQYPSEWSKKEFKADDFYRVNDNTGEVVHCNGFAVVPKKDILVIDIDKKNGVDGELSLPELNIEVGDTLTQTTMNGGYHLVYRHPEAYKLTNDSGYLPGIDIRNSAGNIRVEPTKGYNWLDINSGEWNKTNIKLLPEEVFQKLLSMCNAKKERVSYDIGNKVGYKIPNGSRNSFLTSRAGGFLKSGYKDDMLFTLVMGVNNHFLEHPLDEREVEGICTSISRYESPNMEDILEMEEIDKKLDKLFAKKTKKEIKDKEIFTDYINTGLIGKISDFILQTSTDTRQPLLAMASTISFVGALLGRRYATETDLRSNVYVVGLLGSGEGKDHAMKCIDFLATKLGLDSFIGGGDWTSASAVINPLATTPIRMFQLDEFGKKLKSITMGQAGDYKAEILSTLLELYSKSNTIYRGKEYANKKDNQTAIIYNPHVNMYCASTPDTFYDALSSRDSVSGFIPRFIIVQPPEMTMDNIVLDVACSINKYNTSSIEEIVKVLIPSELLTNSNVDTSNSIKVVKMDHAAKSKFNDLRISLKFKSKKETEKAIYNRVAENIAKIALIVAVSENPREPIITEKVLDWSIKFILYFTDQTMDNIRANIYDNIKERNVKKVLAEIPLKKWISKSDLFIATQFVYNERKHILEDLIESEQIEVKCDVVGSKNKISYRRIK